MKNLTTLAASVIAAWGVCTSVWADTILEPRSVTVHFEDLDINSTPGVATLYKRIRSAAAFVCNDLGTSRSLVYLGRYKTCVHGAVSVAVARINRAAVTEYAAARGIVPPDMPIKGKFARNT
jgi:UrcA family protein